jgi:uncharacterized protein YbjQ (UPF0145 family)
MIVVTTESVPGYVVVESLGVVRGNSVRARSLFRDIMAIVRLLVGGEIREYTKMLAETREQALDRMGEEAEGKGANAVIGVRFVTAQTMAGAAEFLAYGTAVRISRSK